MRDADAGPRQPGNLGSVKMHAVREPDAVMQPPDFLKIVERPVAKARDAEFGLVLRLREVRVQPHAAPPRQHRRLAHQRRGHGERRTWRQRDLYIRVVAGLVVPVDHRLAVGQNGIFVLHDAVRRQPAVALRQVHRAARQHRADAEPLRDRDLDVDRVVQPGRKHVVVVGGRGAAGEQQLSHRDRRGTLQRRRRQPRPHRIQRAQPAEQLAVQRRRRRPRQCLVEVMVRVDQAGNDDVRAGPECPHVGRGRFAAGRYAFDDPPALHDDATRGVVGKNRQRVLQPERTVGHPRRGVSPACPARPR
jgi:hypothetical protein